MSTVYGIVKQVGGDIQVYSELGTGTTFKIYLPIALEEPDSADDGASEPDTYEVLTAGGPSEALELVESGIEEVDLLISDVVMPDMNGQELADRLRERSPALKVLFSSGYSGEAINQNGLLTNGFQLISKPYSVEEFREKVESVLRS